MTPVKVEGFLVFRHRYFASQCLNHGRAHADQELSHVGASIQAADELLHTSTKSSPDSCSNQSGIALRDTAAHAFKRRGVSRGYDLFDYSCAIDCDPQEHAVNGFIGRTAPARPLCIV